VVIQLNIISIAIPPPEANAPSPDNSNAILAHTVSDQFLQMVASRRSQIRNPDRIVDTIQFAPSAPNQLGRKRTRGCPV